MNACPPKTMKEKVFQLAIGIYAFLAEAVLVNQMLVVFHVFYLSKTHQLKEIEELEKYLLVTPWLT